QGVFCGFRRRRLPDHPRELTRKPLPCGETALPPPGICGKHRGGKSLFPSMQEKAEPENFRFSCPLLLTATCCFGIINTERNNMLF
ncbi:hypothetical protein KH017_11630, partial [bacterium]|nr:hypothetical protein [bacterium]